MTKDTMEELVSTLNKLHDIIKQAKEEDKSLANGFYLYSSGSILNAYREGDLSFNESVSYLNDITKKATGEKLSNNMCSNCDHYHQGYLCLKIGNGNFQPTPDFNCNFHVDKIIS